MRGPPLPQGGPGPQNGLCHAGRACREGSAAVFYDKAVVGRPPGVAPLQLLNEVGQES